MIVLESIFIVLALIAISLYFLFSWQKKDRQNLLQFLLISAVVMLAVWVTERSVVTGHAPFSGAYESIVFFMFLFTLKLAFLFKAEVQIKRWLLVPVFAFLMAAFFLPPSLKTPNLLVPSLQSPWIFVHVPAMFMGYVSLTFAFVLALIMRFTDRDMEDRLTSQMKQSFFFLTLGIILGAAWAERAWGNYWGWDNKEIWALITWLITEIYFHVWSKKLKFWIVMAAFAALLFTYFGVMFIIPGLHSYK